MLRLFAMVAAAVTSELTSENLKNLESISISSNDTQTAQQILMLNGEGGGKQSAADHSNSNSNANPKVTAQ